MTHSEIVAILRKSPPLWGKLCYSLKQIPGFSIDIPDLSEFVVWPIDAPDVVEVPFVIVGFTGAWPFPVEEIAPLSPNQRAFRRQVDRREGIPAHEVFEVPHINKASADELDDMVETAGCDLEYRGFNVATGIHVFRAWKPWRVGK